jgi:hypothetical protein
MKPKKKTYPSSSLVLVYPVTDLPRVLLWVSFNKALVQSLENVFVHANGILDLESTTTRPLWAAAHLPAFIQSSPFVEKLFRNVVANLGSDPNCNNLSPFPLKNIPLHQ